MNNIAVTENHIAKHLNDLKTSKASGPDRINARLQKELNVHIAPILKILFNTSITKGNLSYQWKEAHVIALFKKDSKRSANNYRPVSLASLCCKILEHIIRDSIVDKLEGEGLIDKDQHRFRGGRSCCTQLLEVMETWTRRFDLGLSWDAIYTDLSKAFDSVPHERLLKKIEAHGIQGNISNWIRDFLHNHKQRVVLG